MAESGNRLNLDIICLESEALVSLIEEVSERLKEKHSLQNARWISAEEAMELLRIKSKTTLKKIYETGQITITEITPKLILYDKESILTFLDNQSKQAPK